MENYQPSEFELRVMKTITDLGSTTPDNPVSLNRLAMQMGSSETAVLTAVQSLSNAGLLAMAGNDFHWFNLTTSGNSFFQAHGQSLATSISSATPLAGDSGVVGTVADVAGDVVVEGGIEMVADVVETAADAVDVGEVVGEVVGGILDIAGSLFD